MSDDCYTPRAIIEIAREVMGGIDLDPASCAEAQEVVRAGKYYSLEQSTCNPSYRAWPCDGLYSDWSGRVWCNPPYSDCGPWVEKAVRCHDQGSTDAICMLLPVSVGVSWWRPVWSHPIMWIGRLEFWGPGARTKKGEVTGSRQDIAMVLMTQSQDMIARFRKQASLYGYKVTWDKEGES